MWLLALLGCEAIEPTLTVEPTEVEFVLDVETRCPTGLGAGPVRHCERTPVTLFPNSDGTIYVADDVRGDHLSVIPDSNPEGVPVEADAAWAVDIEACAFCQPGEPMPERGEHRGSIVWGLLTELGTPSASVVTIVVIE